MKSLMTLAASIVLAVTANAGELDNNQPNVSSTESTIVVRVNTQTGAVEKFELNANLSKADAQALAQDASVQFEKAKSSQIKGELDQEAGASSWYWYCPQYYSTPSYGWGYNYGNTGFYNYGNWYSSYYNYNYGNWNYYYYQPYYGNNYGCNNWGWSNNSCNSYRGWR